MEIPHALSVVLLCALPRRWGASRRVFSWEAEEMFGDIAFLPYEEVPLPFSVETAPVFCPSLSPLLSYSAAVVVLRRCPYSCLPFVGFRFSVLLCFLLLLVRILIGGD